MSGNADPSYGSAEFEWQGVPKELDNWEEPRYTLSAHCDGYKTRTYTNVAPDTPRNLYLTRLRKIYVMTDLDPRPTRPRRPGHHLCRLGV